MADTHAIPRQREGSSDAEEFPELTQLGWFTHLETLTSTGFLKMSARLPSMVAQALRLSWRAARGMTVLTIGLNIAAGLGTVVSLLTVFDVAATLFEQAPTLERVQAAVPGLILLGGVLAARTCLGFAAGWAQSRLTPLVGLQVQEDFYELTTAVPLLAFDDADFSDDMERSTNRGMDAGPEVVSDAVDVLTGVIGIVAVAAAVAIVHPLLLVFVAIAVLPVGWAAVRSARIGYESLRVRIARRRRLHMLGGLMASRHTAEEVRSNQLGAWLLERYRAMATVELRADLSLNDRQTRIRIVGTAAGGAASALMYVALFAMLVTGMIALAAAAGAVYALQQATGAMRNTVDAVTYLFDDALYWNDHLEFVNKARARLDRPESSSAPVPVEAPALIECQGLGLTYPGEEQPALDGIDCVIRQGETIALVGVNGSGKSTLAKVLAGLYRPSTGSLAWDGVDTAKVELGSMRDHIAVVSQDYQSWPFTAGANITLSRQDADGLSMEDAARAADAFDMVMELPNGFDTLLDRQFKDGHELSRGQWQRLSAARGFFRSAPILICDEPSAALDALAEHQLFQSLRAREGTTILITHRLANVRHATRILVLEHGSLVEEGTHDALMAEDGVYARLFGLQAKGYAESDEEAEHAG